MKLFTAISLPRRPIARSNGYWFPNEVADNSSTGEVILAFPSQFLVKVTYTLFFASRPWLSPPSLSTRPAPSADQEGDSASADAFEVPGCLSCHLFSDAGWFASPHPVEDEATSGTIVSRH